MNLKDHFMPQKMMSRVLYALCPILLFSIWQYGWRVLVLFVIVSIVGILAEYWMMRLIQGKQAKVTESVLVTCLLFSLTLPPAIPIYMAIIGILVAVIFGKGVFGGFGRNIFNPALVGRCFIYINFPSQMTMEWTEPFRTFPGGFACWTRGVDAMTSSTPMIALESAEEAPQFWELFLGTHAGSMGEVSILLIILAAIYLIATKTASWKIMLSVLGGGFASALIFQLAGAEVAPLETVLFTGGLFFAAVFMATDPVSAPKDEASKVIVGILIGFLSLSVRTFGLFTEGAMFAVLVGNAVTPLIDRQIRSLRNSRQKKTKEVTA